MKEKLPDIAIVCCLAAVMYTVMYILTGFSVYGLSSPLIYSGGDEMGVYMLSELIIENGGITPTDRMGAPFGTDMREWPAHNMMGADVLIIKLLALFSDDFMRITNIRYLLIFPMCAVSAYCVFRELGLKRALSAAGGVLFALTPYIRFRSVPHMVVSTIYFVPLSVLLCIWSAGDGSGDYLRFDRNFLKNRKNVLSVIFCILIANNGIGYFPFFTCFFLCVAVICSLFSSKKLRSVIAPAKNIAMITVFMLIPMIPYLLSLRGGKEMISIRSPYGSEEYGLKTAQLFIPFDSHGIPLLETLINGYNEHMPLVNENRGAYLGIAGAAGFLISLALLIIPVSNDRSDSPLFLLSRMNICAVLLGTVGGFSSLISAFFRLIRAYNRISVFIMFISLCLLLMCTQDLYERYAAKAGGGKKTAALCCAGVLYAFCALELLPSRGAYNRDFEAYSALYKEDREFVSLMETTLGDGAMVYQLPCHPFPEEGSVGGMADYRLMYQYLCSDRLKFSYGFFKLSDNAEWQETVSRMDCPEMLETLTNAGFTGLYIEPSAYTAQELADLTGRITAALGKEPVTDGKRIFYDLR